MQQARKNRPKKHRLSDINRTPPKYDVEPMIAARKSIPEYTKIGEVCVCVCVASVRRWLPDQAHCDGAHKRGNPVCCQGWGFPRR